MAVKHARVSVGTTRVVLHGGGYSDAKVGQSICLKNVGAATVFIGDATVTSSGVAIGYPLDPGEAIAFDLASDADKVYGVVASGTQNVAVIRTGA